MNHENVYNIGNIERLMRVVLGVGLIFDVLHGTGPLGWAALIPLVCIYPILTGFLGHDPIYATAGYSSVSAGQNNRMASSKAKVASVPINNIGNAERLMRVTLGVGLIVDVMLGAGSLGLAMLIPLVSIYPLMTGFLGYDPIYAAIGYSSNRSGQKSRESSRKKDGFFNGALHS